MLYGGGLFNRCVQDGNVYNHAVTLMGMEADGTWIVRNSWGTKWGDNGHIYISSGNSCSISSFGVVPTINFSAIESSRLGSEKDRN
jgi:aminopeptidase C